MLFVFMLVLVKSFNNAQVVNVLEEKQAMSYTIVVAAVQMILLHYNIA
jgi:F0F1-type ATP synthase alpha subunit